MICPFCSCENTRVLESRLSNEKSSIRRRRECENCEKRFTTYERVENYSILVIKKDRTKEKFSGEKLLKSISQACIKTGVSDILIGKIVESIESEIFMTGKKEVTSALVGEKVIKHLKDTSEIAYLRYLSVFKEYKNIEELFNELKNSPQMPVLF